jgi:hypothetical protein
LAFRRSGPTYVYSHLYIVLGALGRLLSSFTAANIVEGPVYIHLSWLKRPPAVPSAALHNPLWDIIVIFALRPATPP